METPSNSNNDDDDKPPNSTSDPDPPTVFGKRQQLRCCEPDLEVVVGSADERTIFRHHAVLLASYSDFIDTLLTADRSTKRITFSDLSPTLWRKMMRYLEPGGQPAASFKSVLELIPVFHKYGFHVGLELIDDVAQRFFENIEERAYIVHDDDLFTPRLASLCYEYNFPRSKALAVQFAKRQVRGTTLFLEPKELQVLLPLVRNDKEILTYMLGTVMGKSEQELNEMTVEAMGAMTQQDSFAPAFRTRCQQIRSHGYICSKVTAENLQVESAGESAVNGRYEKKKYCNDVPTDFGTMPSRYEKHVDVSSDSMIYLETTDPFGSSWQFRLVKIGEDDEKDKRTWLSDDDDDDDDEDDDDNRPNTETTTMLRRAGRVLYTWQSDFSSLLPPKWDWQAVNGAENPPPQLQYSVKGTFI